MRKRTAVLIHGCHLEAEGWDGIVNGLITRNGALLGRVPKGLAIAREEEAELLYFGTGASEREGMKESEVAYAAARNLLDAKGKRWLRSIVFCDTTTQNTTEEVHAAVKMCTERGIERLILVSSPTHIPRCMVEAGKLRTQGKFSKLEVMALASDTCFVGSTPSEVIVVEPPHRGDMPKWQTFRYVRAIFEVMAKGHAVFAPFLYEFGELLTKYGVKVSWGPLPKPPRRTDDLLHQDHLHQVPH